ncbi:MULTISPECIES: HAD family hydrolase [unclassified Clostridium]|uniref:HAD family hydrolase n=1 Tax=unclassified Clostridium TaxID=2614128 RepID=UPI000ED8E31A|nr:MULTISPECIES: HAD-IA family hydrolase [unclassified Clostridium]HCQ90461.1 hydrolase [Clostridium sp.]
MIKTVIFDLDDTLYEELLFVKSGFKEVCIFLSQKYNLNFNEMYEECLSILNKYGRGKIFNILCETYNIDENISNLVNIYRSSKPILYLYEDSMEIIKELREKNYNLAIITDGDSKVQWNKIRALKLENFMEKILVCDDLGKEYWKPHEKPYLEVVNYFNNLNNECVYIGDNPNKDFIGARKLGIRTIRIIRKQGDHMKTFLEDQYEADFTINNLLQIKDIIKYK